MNDKKEQRNNREGKTKILIVNGNSVVRRGLIQLINQQSGFVVCAEAENDAQALEAIEKQRFDLAVVDISLEGTAGVQLVEKIKLRCPNLPVLTLSMREELHYAKRALQAGAEEYILNQRVSEQIIKAIRHAQSLIRSRVFGFTVFLRAKRSEQE